MNLPSPDEFMDETAKRLQQERRQKFADLIAQALHLESGTFTISDMKELRDQIVDGDHWDHGQRENSLVWYWRDNFRFVLFDTVLKVEGRIGDHWVMPVDHTTYNSIDEFLFYTCRNLEEKGFKFDKSLKGDV